jgi:hypothetical protein
MASRFGADKNFAIFRKIMCRSLFLRLALGTQTAGWPLIAACLPLSLQTAASVASVDSLHAVQRRPHDSLYQGT